MPAYAGGKIYRHAELGAGGIIDKAEAGWDAWKRYSMTSTATPAPKKGFLATYGLPLALASVAVATAIYFYKRSK